MKRDSRAPLLVAILLLVLPALYVGSYLALVMPAGRFVFITVNYKTGGAFRIEHYRVGEAYAARVFWPLEQIDRRVRSGAWERDYR